MPLAHALPCNFVQGKWYEYAQDWGKVGSGLSYPTRLIVTALYMMLDGASASEVPMLLRRAIDMMVPGLGARAHMPAERTVGRLGG